MLIINIPFILSLITILSFCCRCISMVSFLEAPTDNSANTHSHAIPVLTFSFNFDPSNYATKLIKSIDYPVKLLWVQIGDSNPVNNVEQMVDKVGAAISKNKFIHHSLVHTLPYNPGLLKDSILVSLRCNEGMKAGHSWWTTTSSSTPACWNDCTAKCTTSSPTTLRME